MTKYFYKALENQKDLVTGYVDANSQQEAREKIRKMGFFPTNIYEENPISEKPASVSRQVANFRLSLGDKISFTSELQNLFSSGISPLEALETIERYSPQKKIRVIARNIQESIKNGSTLTEAFEMYSKTFGDIYLNLTRASEESGALPGVLDYLVMLLKKQNDLKSKYIQMAIYPAILILMLVALFFVAGGFIFPRLIYNMQIDTPPASAAFLMDSVTFIVKHWVFLLVSGVASVYGLNFIIGFDRIKEWFIKGCMKVPVIANCIKYFSLVHYMTVLYIAYESGVPILRAMNMAESTIGSKTLKEKAHNATRFVNEGKSITEAFDFSGLMPGVLMPLISTGEKTGKLGQMFRDAAIGIEKKLNIAMEALARAFEPAMILVIGCCVGYIAVAIMQMYAQSFSALLGM